MPRTVQEYIDETPMWADSTAVRYSPMTNMQWFIWGLAAGKFFEGMVVFTTGVALPLMGREFALGATEKGVVAFVTLGLDPGSTLAEAHARASEVEERLRRARPDVADVIVHTEP